MTTATTAAPATNRDAFIKSADQLVQEYLRHGTSVARLLANMTPYIEESMAHVPKSDKMAEHPVSVAKGKARILGLLFGSNAKVAQAILKVAVAYGVKSEKLDEDTMEALSKHVGLSAHAFWLKVAKQMPSTKQGTALDLEQKANASSLRNVSSKVSGLFNELGWRERAKGEKAEAATTAPTEPIKAGGFNPGAKDEPAVPEGDNVEVGRDEILRAFRSTKMALQDVAAILLEVALAENVDMSGIFTDETIALVADSLAPANVPVAA